MYNRLASSYVVAASGNALHGRMGLPMLVVGIVALHCFSSEELQCLLLTLVDLPCRALSLAVTT